MKIPADFDAEIWSVVAEIPAGRVATYGQLARLIGMPGHARRAGGDAAHVLHERLADLPAPVQPGGAAEGVRFRANGCVDLSASGWEEIG